MSNGPIDIPEPSVQGDSDSHSEATKPSEIKSITRVSPKLSENSAGKYLVSISFTFDEVTEMRKALHDRIRHFRSIRKSKDYTAEQHAEAGRSEEILSNALRYLYDAHPLLKHATNARQEGRYNAKRRLSA